MLVLAGLLLPVSVAVAVPDVPYLPQTESLCGGASLAMVLRYWGARGVRPADFAAALEPGGAASPRRRCASSPRIGAIAPWPFAESRAKRWRSSPRVGR